MKYQLLFLFCLLLFSMSCGLSLEEEGERQVDLPPPPEPTSIDNNYGCVKKHSYLPNDRLKNYPFDHTKNILLISFDYQIEDTASQLK